MSHKESNKRFQPPTPDSLGDVGKKGREGINGNSAKYGNKPYQGF